ncbi:hypothetical protein IWX49DRAFT_49023 [Phyllosticta citricarpa]|uniref:DUF7924 domain-containing protein n=2 Tax=Phyllosticta TaxID=121621 RepID=A0ABR1MIP1_9PEZI
MARAEQLYLQGDTRLDSLAETTDEPWDCCMPLIQGRTLPAPGYCVGFHRREFDTRERRLRRLRRLFTAEATSAGVGGSVEFATREVLFPFFVAEGSCKTLLQSKKLQHCKAHRSAQRTSAIAGHARPRRNRRRRMRQTG